MRLGLVRAVVPKAEGVGWMRGLGAGVRSRCPAGTWYWRGWARRHALSVTAGLRNGISSVAGSRMRPLALSGLRGWRVATRGCYRWAAQRRFSAWRGPRGGLWAFPGYPAWPWARPGGYGREAERRCARERR